MVYFGLHQHARKGTALDAQQTFIYMDLLCVKLKDTAVVFLMEALKMEVLFKKNKIKLM